MLSHHRTILKDNDETLYGGRVCGRYRYHGAYNFLMEFNSNLELPFKITYTELKVLLDQEKENRAAFQ